MKKLLTFSFTFLLMLSCLNAGNVDWSMEPKVLSQNNVDAADPQITIDPVGNSYAIWTENGVVKARNKSFDGEWSSTSTLSGSHASSASLVVDKSGNATAIWVENGIVKARVKSINTNWKTAKTLSANGSASPAICVDLGGNIIAAWTRQGNIETATKLFLQQWTSSVKINSTNAKSPVIALGGSGTNAKAFVVWQGLAQNKKVIYASEKTLSGPWQAQTVISLREHLADKPFVDVDGNGNALAIWYAYDVAGKNFSNVTVHTAAKPNGSQSWDAVTILSKPGIRNPETLKALVAFDNVGNAIAFWNTSFDDETYTLESAVKSVVGPWGEPVNLVDPNLYAFAADLAVTSFGDVLGLYMFYNGSSLNIQSIESHINGFVNNVWSVPITVSLGSNNAYPKIAAALIGNQIHASAIWTTNDGGNNHVVASTGTKTLTAPPSNLQVMEDVHNFGVFKEYNNRLSWDPSIDPNTARYLVFRQGIFIGEVGADVNEYIDNNRVLDASVSYSLTAIDHQQTQSRTVSISFP